MGIVFFCQSCGARFDVAASLAGKKGRCKKCGQQFTIPKAESLASMMALPAVGAGPEPHVVGSELQGGGVAVAAPAAAKAAAVAPPVTGNWLKNLTSNVGLKPITIQNARPVKRYMADALADGDSKPYFVGEAIAPEQPRGKPGKRPSEVKMVWRRELGVVQKVFRWLNETAYLVSIPFVMVLILGTVIRNRPVALFGATVVILLNIGRVVAGFANIVVIPFRDGISQGISFLIPPITFIYIANNWNRLRRPVMRVLEPFLTVGIVILAFTFIPWLSKGSSSGDISDRLRSGVTTLKADIKGEVNKAKNLDVDKLKADAEAKIKELGTATPPEAPATKTAPPAKGANPEAAVEGLLKGLGERASETIRQGQPNNP